MTDNENSLSLFSTQYLNCEGIFLFVVYNNQWDENSPGLPSPIPHFRPLYLSNWTQWLRVHIYMLFFSAITVSFPFGGTFSAENMKAL